MAEKTFFSRLNRYGRIRIFRSKDFVASAVVLSILWIFSLIPGSTEFLKASIGFHRL